MMRCYGDVQPLGASSLGALVSVVPVRPTSVRRGLCLSRLLATPSLAVVLLLILLQFSLRPTVPNFVPSGCLVTLVSRRAAERETRINTRESHSAQAALNR